MILTDEVFETVARKAGYEKSRYVGVNPFNGFVMFQVYDTGDRDYYGEIVLVNEDLEIEQRRQDVYGTIVGGESTLVARVMK